MIEIVTNNVSASHFLDCIAATHTKPNLATYDKDFRKNIFAQNMEIIGVLKKCVQLLSAMTVCPPPRMLS